MRTAIICTTALLLVGGSYAAADPPDVSLVQLIATPERFDGKHVQVVGYCWLEFEGDALYLSRDDQANMVYRNSIWLSVSREDREKWLGMRGKYVTVSGTFRADFHGHMGMSSGAIEKIDAIRVWSDPKRPGVPRPPRPNPTEGVKRP
jgi:hypothetical protein